MCIRDRRKGENGTQTEGKEVHQKIFLGDISASETKREKTDGIDIVNGGASTSKRFKFEENKQVGEDKR